jgi:hypothetical protein
MTLSWYKRRTLRALPFITVLPKVTWPSPPITTLSPRRTDNMVVPLIFMLIELRINLEKLAILHGIDVERVEV